MNSLRKFSRTLTFSVEKEPERAGGPRKHPHIDLCFPIEFLSPVSTNYRTSPPDSDNIRPICCLRGGGRVGPLPDEERLPKWLWWLSGGMGQPPTAADVRARRRRDEEKRKEKNRLKEERKGKGGGPVFGVDDVDDGDHSEESDGEGSSGHRHHGGSVSEGAPRKIAFIIDDENKRVKKGHRHRRK